jgi:hypothetical protein
VTDEEARKREWANAAITLAADNVRLCNIALAADAVAEAAVDCLRVEGSTFSKHRALKKALEAYWVVRNGS